MFATRLQTLQQHCACAGGVWHRYRYIHVVLPRTHETESGELAVEETGGYQYPMDLDLDLGISLTFKPCFSAQHVGTWDMRIPSARRKPKVNSPLGYGLLGLDRGGYPKVNSPLGYGLSALDRVTKDPADSSMSQSHSSSRSIGIDQRSTINALWFFLGTLKDIRHYVWVGKPALEIKSIISSFMGSGIWRRDS